MTKNCHTFICGEYDPRSGVVGKLFFVVSAEMEGNWQSGDEIRVNGKEYILGPRTLEKRSIIVTYELVVRPPRGLPL